MPVQVNKELVTNAPAMKGFPLDQQGPGGPRSGIHPVQQPTLHQRREVGDQTSILPDFNEVSEVQSQPSGIVIEGLGNLDELAATVKPQDALNEGYGQWVVTLHDSVTGVNGNYPMATLTRVSNLLSAWGTKIDGVYTVKEKAADERKAAQQLLRLFKLNAIRPATPMEIQTKQVTVLSVSPELAAANQQLVEKDNQLAEALRQLNELRQAQEGGVVRQAGHVSDTNIKAEDGKTGIQSVGNTIPGQGPKKDDEETPF